MNLNDLASFVHVVELGTITAAAAFEGVPKSTISRRIKRLENELGVALLQRSSREVVVTDDGRMLFSRSVGALRELRDAEDVLGASSDEPSGRLVLSAPDLIKGEFFVGLLREYRERYPLVRLEIRVENRIVDLVHEGVDVAIRAHGALIPGDAQLMSRAFAVPSFAMYASHSYIERKGMPLTAEEFLGHELIAHVALREHELTLPGAQTLRLDPDACAFVVDDFLLAQALIESGAGIGMLLCSSAEKLVQRGVLVRVLPEWEEEGGRISLVWPTSRHMAPRVRALLDLFEALF